jgi:hypothetical protein
MSGLVVLMVVSLLLLINVVSRENREFRLSSLDLICRVSILVYGPELTQDI